MIDNIYQHLKSHLAAINGIETVDYYLGQYDVEDAESVLYATPALYIEFAPIQWQQMSKKIQRAELNFTIHTVTESIHDDEQRILDTAPDHLALVGEVFIKLQGHRYKQGEQVIMESIERVSSTFDHELRTVLVNTQEFRCMVYDYSALPTTTTTQILAFPISVTIGNVTNSPAEAQPALTDLKVWLDPNYQFSESLWVDKSGNNNNFAQSNPLNRPVKSLGINGRTSISFNGNKHMQLLNKVIAADKMTLHIVVKKTGTFVGLFANIITLSVTSSSVGGTSFFQFRESETFNLATNFNTISLRVNIIPQILNTPRLITIVKSPVGMQTYVNGILINIVSGVQNINNVSHFIGGYLNNMFVGEIGDILIYNNNQAQSERELSEAYLIDKYALV